MYRDELRRLRSYLMRALRMEQGLNLEESYQLLQLSRGYL